MIRLRESARPDLPGDGLAVARARPRTDDGDGPGRQVGERPLPPHVEQVRGDEGVREDLGPVGVSRDHDPGPRALDTVQLAVDVDPGHMCAGTRRAGQVAIGKAVPGLDVTDLCEDGLQGVWCIAHPLAAQLEHPRPGDPRPPLVGVDHRVGASDLGTRRDAIDLGPAHAATAPCVRYISARPTSVGLGTVRPLRSAEVHANLRIRS